MAQQHGADNVVEQPNYQETVDSYDSTRAPLDELDQLPDAQTPGNSHAEEADDQENAVPPALPANEDCERSFSLCAQW